MRYFIDLDNTLCITKNGDYENSVPIKERIEKVNQLKDGGHTVVIWTARGTVSKKDYELLTKTQLENWGIKYDELLLGKPDYDIYIDDKSFQVNNFWPIFTYMNNLPEEKTTIKTKKETPEIVPKGWGKEIIFANNPEYCGKILCFDKGKKFSMHYHIKKKETWYILRGSFILTFIDTANGAFYNEIIQKGDIITNERGEPHQLEALEDAEIAEVSTEHFDEDSYRIWKGN
jgi:quercetin dioxygenase-like cupin family protein